MIELYDKIFFTGRVYPDYSKFKHIHKKRAEYLQSLGVSGDVLEVGCAYGYMVEELRLLDINVVGIDISFHAIEQANSEYVTQQDLKTLDFTVKDYDYIISFNCLDNASSEADSIKTASILNKSDAQQIHIVIMEGNHNSCKYTHQVLLKDPKYWTDLYPTAKIICFACWNIYQHDKPIIERGNWI